LLVGAGGGPIGADAQFVFGLEPEGDLFDGGALQVGRERGLAIGRRGAGEDVAAGVGDAAEDRGQKTEDRTGGRRIEGRGQRNDTGQAEEVF